MVIFVNMHLKNTAYVVIILTASIVGLYFLKPLLVPLIFAFLIWSIIKEVRSFISRSEFIREKFPNWLKTVLSLLVIYGVISALLTIVSGELHTMDAKMAGYEANFEAIVKDINEKFGIDVKNLLSTFFSEMDFSTIAKDAVGIASGAMGNLFIITLYVIFIIFESAVTPLKLKRMFPNKERFHTMHELVQEVNDSITNYIALKSLVSLCNAVLAYITLIIIGVDFAASWAIVIFILNFIPTVGALVATFFPATMALLQFGDYNHFLIVLACIGAIQLIMGNFVEPRVMGNSLNISSLVVIISLVAWGYLWKIEGMILCVPITVILIHIFARFPATRNVAILLSEKGNVERKEE